MPGALGIADAHAAKQIDRQVEPVDQLRRRVPTQRHGLGMALGRLHRRQGDKVHPHLPGQSQLFGVMAGGRQPALRRKRAALVGIFTQLLSRQMPAGRGEVPQPLQRAFEHQLRLAGTQTDHVHRQVAVLRAVHVRRAQLDQAHTVGNGGLNALQQFLALQLVRGDQVLRRQACGAHNRLIGCGEVVVRQLPRADPGQRLAFGTMGLAGKTADFPDIQQHLLVRVVMLHLDQRPRGGNGNAQLFLQFTVQGRGHAFTRLHLAAGELPQSTLMLLIGTLGQQDVAIGTTNHCRRYMYSLHHEGSSRAACNHRWKAGHW